MSMVHVETSLEMDARPEQVHAVISDYRVGHPAILPRPPFTDLTVIKGGQGAGTELVAKMEMAGRKFEYNQIVSEPEPGRVLVEANKDGLLVTTFRFDPLDGGNRCRVTIATDFTPSPGFTGFIERLFNPSVMRDIYRKELRQIAAYVQGKGA